MNSNNDTQNVTVVKRNYECRWNIFIIWAGVEKGTLWGLGGSNWVELPLEGSLEGRKRSTSPWTSNTCPYTALCFMCILLFSLVDFSQQWAIRYQIYTRGNQILCSFQDCTVDRKKKKALCNFVLALCLCANMSHSYEYFSKSLLDFRYSKQKAPFR